MDDLLNTLRSEGELDSSGRFELDWTRAREKLRMWQLTDRYSYILKWVQSAVAAGARMCRTSFRPDQACLIHDGEPFLPDQLKSFWSCLLDGGEFKAAWKVLAIGVNTALGFDKAAVEIESAGPGGGALVRFRGGTMSFSPLVPRPDAATKLTLRRRLGWTSVLLGRASPEVELLRERARWAPLTLYVDSEVIKADFGVPYSTGLPFLPWKLVRYGCSGGESIQVGRRSLAWQRRLRSAPGRGKFRLGRVTGQLDPASHDRSPYQEAAGLYVDPALPGSILWLRHGVVASRTALERGVAGEVLLACDDLATDLSGFGFLEDELFSHRRALACELARDLQRSLRRAFPAERLEDSLVQALAGNPDMLRR
ncbi:MAG: hypothetical protein AMXMBFR33_70460 [Candidatus Xenobia bacterium]